MENLKIIDFLPENSDFKILSMDVTSLCKHPKQWYYYSSEAFPLQHYVKTDIIIRLAEPALNLNTFQFGGKHYSKSGWLAMGTKMGLNFASLFVGYLEEKSSLST